MSYAAVALDDMCENFCLTESQSFSHFQMLLPMFRKEKLAIFAAFMRDNVRCFVRRFVRRFCGR